MNTAPSNSQHKDTTRHVLMALYYFPPFADVSGVRAAKFYKYLPANGWTPTVLTVDKKYYGTKVVNQHAGVAKKKDIWRIPHIAVPGARILVKLLYPFIICAITLKYRRHFDAVYFCGSPFHPFAATWFTTRILGIPSIIDFRDSWSVNEGFDSHSSLSAHSRPQLLKRVELATKRLLEWIGIRYASQVVFATSTLQDEYTAAFPKYCEKFQTITNGFDPEDFVHLTPKKVVKTGKTIVLTGKFLLYTPEAAKLFLQALSETPELTFLYIGGEAEQVSKLAAEVGVSSKVVTFAYMPYQDVLGYIAGADYGLVTNGLRNGLGTKIFDYLALTKPTLCIVPNGSVIAVKFTATPMIHICETPHSIKKIKQVFRQLTRTTQIPKSHEISRFSRVDLTRRLGNMLYQIARLR